MEERPPRRKNDMERTTAYRFESGHVLSKTIILPWSMVILLHLSFTKRWSKDYFLGVVGIVPKSSNNDESFSSSVIFLSDSCQSLQASLEGLTML